MATDAPAHFVTEPSTDNSNGIDYIGNMGEHKKGFQRPASSQCQETTEDANTFLSNEINSLH